MNTVEHGRTGEALAVAHFVKEGYDVFMPMFGNAVNDLIVAKDGQLFRVEIKATKTAVASGNYIAQLRSMRPNRTGTVIRHFDGGKSDLLVVVVTPTEKVHIFNSKDFDGRASVTVSA